MKKSRCLPLPNNEKTKQACDKLLENLANCVRKGFQIPENCLKLVKSSASVLVQGSSNPGWLTFAAYFTRFFGMNYVLSIKMEPCEYSKEDFTNLFSVMLNKMLSVKNAHPDERVFYKPFLERILQFVSNDDDLFQMYKRQDVFRFFHSSNERENFFVQFYEANLHSRARDLGEILKYLERFPEKFRDKMSGIIYGYLQHFIDTVAEPSPNDMEVIFHLISDSLSDEKVRCLLIYLSTSNSAFHHDLLKQLLNEQTFAAKWARVPPSVKLKICISWVKMRDHFSLDNNRIIKGTFEAVDILISCTNVSLYEGLVKQLCNNAIDYLLPNEPIRIIEEFKEIENYPSAVQSCFQELFQITLQRDPHLLKDKQVIALLCGNTR